MNRIAAILCLLLALGCRKAEPVAVPPSSSAEPPEPARRVRQTTVAGSWYPDDPEELSRTVRSWLGQAPQVAGAPVRALLVPHAGFTYSGKIAASAFRQLTPGFERVVMVAANHTDGVDFEGLSPDPATHYATPGGEVPLSPAVRQLLGRPGFPDVPAAHGSHVVEIELPFLREVNDRPFELVPLIAGRMNRPQVRAFARELASMADGRTVFVFSVDLSHFHPYDVAVSKDRPCLEALVRMDADGVIACDVDGPQVLLMMTELAAALELTPRLVAYANSGDVSGQKSRVVGYGAVVYEERFELGRGEGEALTRLARQAVETAVRQGAQTEAPAELTWRWPRLLAKRGAFVTLNRKGELRGCIGSLEAFEPLARNVARNAVSAALRDPRFEPVAPAELAQIAVSLSVLDSPKPLESLSGEALASWLGETRPGLIIEYESRRSTFLPEVWEQLPEPRAFLQHLCAKQGSPPDCWMRPGAKFSSYGSQHFAE